MTMRNPVQLTLEAKERLAEFVVARHMVYVNRSEGKPAPWTSNPILQKYRFCNVYRELDRTTKHIREQWAPRHAPEHVWFAMAVARLLNWPDSLDALGDVDGWVPSRFLRILEKRQAEGQQVFGAAYIVSTNGQSVPKLRYLAEQVLTPMWKDRVRIQPRDGTTLDEFHKRLMLYQGMGSFMAAQVVADVKNTRGAGLDPRLTLDWWTWAAPGPGSMRGLNRLLGNGASKTGIRPNDFLAYLNELQQYVNTTMHAMGFRMMCAQDLQNCLCEFDKYERVRLGEGTPKQLFTPYQPQQEQGALL